MRVIKQQMSTAKLNWMRKGNQWTTGDISAQRGLKGLHFAMEKQATEMTGHPFLVIIMWIYFTPGTCFRVITYFVLQLLFLAMMSLCLP